MPREAPMKRSQSESRVPLEVTFRVEVGQVWIDRNGVSWYVKDHDLHGVYLERTEVIQRDPHQLVRWFRQPTDPKTDGAPKP